MTLAYPTTKVLIDDNRDGLAEADITARVVSDIDLLDGFRDAKSTNRIPPSGSIKFALENSDGYYESAAQLLGKSVSLLLVYEGKEIQIFWGYITDAGIDSGPYFPRHVPVTVQDWFYTASHTTARDLAVLTNKRADEAIPYVLGVTTIPPAYTMRVPVGDPNYEVEITGTDLDTGTETFPSVFDSKEGKVFAELDKLVKSELGRLYLIHNRGTQGQIMRLEAKYARGSTRPLSQSPVNYAVPNQLKYHGSGGTAGLIKYHGAGSTSGFINIREVADASFSNHFDAGWNSGKLIVNEYSVTNTPRKTDASPVVIYTLGSPIEFGTGERKRIQFVYSNPVGGSLIQASSVTITDYALNELSDGTGTDLTANLVVGSGVAGGGAYGANKALVAFENLGPAGYLITFELSGLGVYKYNSVEQTAENVESKTFMRTEVSESITREYSNDLNTSIQFANSEVALHRHPTRDINWASFHANDDEAKLLAFMFLEKGDKVRITENFPAHVGDYYIQGRKAKIGKAGKIDFTWYLEEEVRTLCTPVAVAGPTVEAVDAIDFGILPYLANLPQFSYSFWIRRDATDAHFVIMGRTVDEGAGRRGNEILTNDDGKIYFQSYKTPDDGEWITTSAVLTVLEIWYHVAVTYDNTTDTADPIIYIDGVPVAITENNIPSGTSDDDSDCPLVLFNAPIDPAVPALPYLTGATGFTLKDPRIYDHILNTVEVADLAANESILDNVQDGLLFQGIYAPTDNIADYVGDTIEDDDWVLDIVHRAAGIPYNHDAPTANTMMTGETI
jgi:hypothetical protein